MVFKLKKKDKNYAQVHVNMLRDKNLSLKSKGLGAVLESYSDDFNVSLKSIEIGSKDGKKALKTAIKELENGYYLFRFQTRDEQGLFVTYWAFDSAKLDTEYLKELIAELEKVELITPGYHFGTPVTGVPLSGPRLSAPRKSTPYNNSTYKNKRDKNNLSLENEEEIFCFKKFKEEYLKKYDNKDISISGIEGWQHLTIKNGYLHNCINNKDLKPDDAKEVWGAMYQHYLATKNKNQKTA
jgi:hypothetical protein